jgi:hypothetical protein
MVAKGCCFERLIYGQAPMFNDNIQRFICAPTEIIDLVL